MGANQSQAEPDVIRIDRREIPEEYKTVGVSSDVVKRVNAQKGISSNIDDSVADKLRTELSREREEKLRLREEMARLSQLQQRTILDRPAQTIVTDDIEERKKVFDETVERVQTKFFSYHRENVCRENEEEIMSCLKSNQNRVLKCAPLTDLYEKCVSDFRQQVLKGN